MATVDFFLKIDGIDGESNDQKHKNEIEVLSWSWGETNSGSSFHGTGAGQGKVAMQDFNFTMLMNKASPNLQKFCANGKHIPTCTFTARRAGEEQQEYLKITFSDVLISSYQTGGSGGDLIPVDQISFNFTKIKTEYKPQNADGTLGSAIEFEHNVKENVTK